MISPNFHDLLFFRILLFVQNCLMVQESLFCGFLVRLSFHLGKPQVSLEILVKIVCNVFHLGPLQMPFTSNWGLFERRANLPSFPQVSWEPSLSCQPCMYFCYCYFYSQSQIPIKSGHVGSSFYFGTTYILQLFWVNFTQSGLFSGENSFLMSSLSLEVSRLEIYNSIQKKTL